MADCIFTQHGDGNVQIVDKTGMEHELACARAEIAALRDEIDRLCAALKLAQARAADMEAEVERLRARWEETASDNTGYRLSHSDGIYTVSDQNGHVVCEFIRAAEEAARAALEKGETNG